MPNFEKDDLSPLEALRLERGLAEADVAADPIAQFKRWFADAEAADIELPNAMAIATAGPDGQPAVRSVLLKDVDERGFVFYTNYDSRKAHEIEANPRVALMFYWRTLDRQVRIEGVAERTSREESEAYFHSRPRESQLGAWASHQSQVIENRASLEKQLEEIVKRFGGGPIPLPEFWGGYRVAPIAVEFWQGRIGRLHDRLRYRRAGDGGESWIIERLAP